MREKYARFTVVISFIFFVIGITVNAQTVFQKHYSDITEYQELSVSSFDNSYVIAGSSRDKDGLYDFTAMKVDNNGQIIWSKTFPSPYDDYVTSIYISPSGDILLGGYKLDAGDFDFSLMKINASGDLQWYKTYGTTGLDISPFVGATTNGDFFICGNRNTDKLPMVIKINGSGDVLWSKTFGASLSDQVTSVLGSAVTKDGGLAVFGEYKSKNYLMKIGSDGTVAWTTSHNVTSIFEALCSVKQTSDDGFIVIGRTPYCSATLCYYNFACMKLDNKGNVVWSKKIDNKYVSDGKAALETSDGGFVLTGQITDPVTQVSKLILLKTDSKGNYLFTKAYGEADSQGEYACIEQAPDGGFVLLGDENSEAFLIKTDAAGNTSCNANTLNLFLEDLGVATSGSVSIPELKDSLKTTAMPVCSEVPTALKDSLLCSQALNVDELSGKSNCKAYPSPFKETVTIDVINHKSLNGSFEFTMYDVFGRNVMQLPMNNQRLVISRGNLPAGIYFYDVHNDGKVIGSGKIVAE